jgi:large subunit ribosomal protein L17
MRRNIVASLFENETISTTIEKAKEIKPFAEKLITLAKKGTLAARRRAIALLGNRDIVKEENRELVKKGTVIGKLFSDIAPRFLDRPGGYTRIIKLAKRRLGDNGRLVLLQLVGKEEKKKTPKAASKKTVKHTAETKQKDAAEPLQKDAAKAEPKTKKQAGKK